MRKTSKKPQVVTGPSARDRAVGEAWVEYERQKAAAKEAYDHAVRPARQALARANIKAEEALAQAIASAPKS